jgi:hypothetical protein
VDEVANTSSLYRTCNRNEDTTNRRGDPSPAFRRDRTAGSPLGLLTSVRAFPKTENSPGVRPRNLRRGLPNRGVGLLDPRAFRATRFRRDTRREIRSTAGKGPFGEDLPEHALLHPL